MANSDRLYYWTGGTERGQWIQILCRADEFEANERELDRMGFLNHVRADEAPTEAPRPFRSPAWSRELGFHVAVIH